MAEKWDHILNAVPFPVAWEVECPSCGERVDVPMNEQIDQRTFESGDEYGDPHVTCECGAPIRPVTMCVMTK